MSSGLEVLWVFWFNEEQSAQAQTDANKGNVSNYLLCEPCGSA